MKLLRCGRATQTKTRIITTGNKKPKFPKQKQMSREASQQVIITVPLKKMSQATILRQSILDDVVLNIKYR